MLAGGAGQDRDRSQVYLAGDAPRIGVEAQAVHFGDRRAAAFYERGDVVAAGLHVGRHADELHLGAGHARRRDDLQHAARRSALGRHG